MTSRVAAARKVLTAQRDICEAQHHILTSVTDEISSLAHTVIRMRLLSAIEHLASAAQDAERGTAADRRDP